MAYELVPKTSVLQLTYDRGIDGDGKKLYLRRSMSNVLPTAEAEKVYNVASVIAGLQNYPLDSIIVTERKELTNVG